MPMVSSIVAKKRATKRTLLSNARRMRHEPTDAERKFWRTVRSRAFGGYKFKRQYSVGTYIVDFVCLERSLIIELDGGQHADRRAYDAKRTAYLENLGFQVLRYWNTDVLKHPNTVFEDLARALAARTPSPAAR